MVNYNSKAQKRRRVKQRRKKANAAVANKVIDPNTTAVNQPDMSLPALSEILTKDTYSMDTTNSNLKETLPPGNVASDLYTQFTVDTAIMINSIRYNEGIEKIIHQLTTTIVVDPVRHINYARSFAVMFNTGAPKYKDIIFGLKVQSQYPSIIADVYCYSAMLAYLGGIRYQHQGVKSIRGPFIAGHSFMHLLLANRNLETFTHTKPTVSKKFVMDSNCHNMNLYALGSNSYIASYILWCYLQGVDIDCDTMSSIIRRMYETTRTNDVLSGFKIAHDITIKEIDEFRNSVNPVGVFMYDALGVSEPLFPRNIPNYNRAFVIPGHKSITDSSFLTNKSNFINIAGISDNRIKLDVEEEFYRGGRPLHMTEIRCGKGFSGIDETTQKELISLTGIGNMDSPNNYALELLSNSYDPTPFNRDGDVPTVYSNLKYYNEFEIVRQSFVDNEINENIYLNTLRKQVDLTRQNAKAPGSVTVDYKDPNIKE